METRQSPDDHQWVERTIKIEGSVFMHRFCTKCCRDLARRTETESWRAVHVGAIKFDFLDDKTTENWLSERCPGRQLPEDVNALRMIRFE